MEVEKWTGEETIKIKDIIATLNEITELDPNFMHKLTFERHPCSAGIRDHKTVQAHCYDMASFDNPSAGFLGVINGLLGIDKNVYGPISANVDKDTKVLKGFSLVNTDKISEELKESNKNDS